MKIEYIIYKFLHSSNFIKKWLYFLKIHWILAIHLLKKLAIKDVKIVKGTVPILTTRKQKNCT